MRRLTPGRTPSSRLGQRCVAEKHPPDQSLVSQSDRQVNYVQKTNRTGFEPSTPRSDRSRKRQTKKVAATQPESLCEPTPREKRRLDALQQTFRIFSTRGGDRAARPGGCSASGERKAQRLFTVPLFFQVARSGFQQIVEREQPQELA